MSTESDPSCCGREIVSSRLAQVALFTSILLGMLVVCGATGRLSPHVVPDTASYQNYSLDSAKQIASEIRTPVYPLLLKLVGWLVPDGQLNQVVVWIQLLVHAVTSAWLAIELMRWRVPVMASIAACVAVAVGCTFWDHGSTIATDSLAMTVGVMIMIAVMKAWREGVCFRNSMTIGVLVTLAIGIRPAYLCLIPWVALMMLVRPMIASPAAWRRRVRDMLVVCVPPIVVLLAWCGFRGLAVGDFGVLPFGHQNMAAVTTQLLDSEELEMLPGSVGELGGTIATMREKLSRNNASTLDPQAADQLDLREVPSVSRRANAYMTIENRWDAMTYFVVIPSAAQHHPDTLIAQHQALAELDRTIVKKYPLRYLKWWLLAIRRGIWGAIADIAMHPFYLAFLLALAVYACGRVSGFFRSFASAPSQSSDGSLCQNAWPSIYPLFLVSVTYAGTMIAFVALTSPPIGRFVDAGAVLIPAWLTASAVIWCQQRTSSI